MTLSRFIGCCLFLLMAGHSQGQPKTITEIKTAIEKSGNGPLYVKDVLKKKFRIDTVMVLRTSHFNGLADSLAYHGKVGKVYGPYDKGRILVQVLAQVPNTFNRVSQIYIDTSVFMRRFADSLADDIIGRIQQGKASFEDMAQTYSMGGESATRGDLGWVAAGSMIPQIEKELAKRKKGEVFKVWTAAGVHILRKTENPKQATGFALMMRVLL